MGGRDSRSYILLLPSIFTTGNLFCGFYSILQSFSHGFEQAAYAIILAGVFDILDGRVARFTRSTSKFGLEYDSIADVVSFGVAPAVLSYVWALQGFGRVGFAAAFFFAACGALRLARFNTITTEMPKAFFVGLPIPMAANLIAATAIFYHDLHFEFPEQVMLILMFALGLLMVSTVRYRSFKDLDFRYPRSFLFLVLFVAFVALVVVKPELTLCMVFGYYVLWGPVREIFLWARRAIARRGVAGARGTDRSGGTGGGG